MSNQKERTGATKVDAAPSSATGTNMYVNILLLIASVFGGMSADTATMVAAAGTGVIGAIFALRNWFVTARLTTGKTWVGDPNNWAYVAAIVTGIIPAAAPLVEPLRGLAASLIAGNWPAIITGAVTLISLVYYTFFCFNPSSSGNTAQTVAVHCGL